MLKKIGFRFLAIMGVLELAVGIMALQAPDGMASGIVYLVVGIGCMCPAAKDIILFVKNKKK